MSRNVCLHVYAVRFEQKKIPLYANLVGEVLYILFLASNTHSVFFIFLFPSFSILSYFHFKFVFLVCHGDFSGCDVK